MEVEDHPLDYGDFEGTIPKGQYGGGTVMLWDRGYWAPEKGFEKIGEALAKGELKFVMEGERMHGSWVIVRTRRDNRGKASWLLIKHRDEGARRGRPRRCRTTRTVPWLQAGPWPRSPAGKGEAAKPFMTSSGARAPARSGRATATIARPRARRFSKAQDSRQCIHHPPKGKRSPRYPLSSSRSFVGRWQSRPSGPGWAHEIKFDGYRMQLRIDGGKATLLTRKGLDWSDKFPEIAAAARRICPKASSTARWWPWITTACRISPPCRRRSPSARPVTWCSSSSTSFRRREDLRPLPLSRTQGAARRPTSAAAPPNIRYRRPFRHRRGRRAAVGLPDGAGRHRLQAA